eukprot:gene8244-5943_t
MASNASVDHLVSVLLANRQKPTVEVWILHALRQRFETLNPAVLNNTAAVLQLLPLLLQIAADDRPASDAAARDAEVILSLALAATGTRDEVRQLYLEALEPHCETLLMTAIRARDALRPALLASLAAALRRRLPPGSDEATRVRTLVLDGNEALQLPQPLRQQPALALRLVGALSVAEADADADADPARNAQRLFVRYLQRDASGEAGDVAMVTSLLATLAARWSAELATAFDAQATTFGAYGAQATNAPLVTAAGALKDGAWQRAAGGATEVVWLLGAALAAEQPLLAPPLAPQLQQLLGQSPAVDAAAVALLRQLLRFAAALRHDATVNVAELAPLLRQLRETAATRRAAEAIVAAFALPATLQRALTSPAATAAAAEALAAALPCDADDWLVGCLHVPALRLDEAAVVAALRLPAAAAPTAAAAAATSLLLALLDQAPTLQPTVAQFVRMAQAVASRLPPVLAADVGAAVTKLLAVDAAQATTAELAQLLDVLARGVEASGPDAAAERQALGDALRGYVAGYAQRQESDSHAAVLARAVALLVATPDAGRWTPQQAALVAAWTVANPATRETLRPLRPSLCDALSADADAAPRRQLQLLATLFDAAGRGGGAVP